MEEEEVEYDSETGELKDSKEEIKEEVEDLNERSVITSIDELNETAKLRIEELEKKKEQKEKVVSEKETVENNGIL